MVSKRNVRTYVRNVLKENDFLINQILVRAFGCINELLKLPARKCYGIFPYFKR